MIDEVRIYRRVLDTGEVKDGHSRPGSSNRPTATQSPPPSIRDSGNARRENQILRDGRSGWDLTAMEDRARADC